MTALLITMTVILLLAIGVGLVVMVGMRGALKDKAPSVANHMAAAARHMNGDAEPPQAFMNLVQSGSRS